MLSLSDKTFLSFLFSTEFEAMISGKKRLWSGRKVETVFWYSCPCLKFRHNVTFVRLPTSKIV